MPTEDQLQAWEAFLNIEERIAKARQFCVPFVSHNYGKATRNITFVIDADSATIDGSVENSLGVDDFWQRANGARKENVKLIGDQGRELGSIEAVNSEHGRITVRLESEVLDLIAEGLYRLPNTGALSFEAVGAMVEIKRKKQALQDLKHGHTQNPYLGQFLFDASQARLPQATVQLQQQDLLLKSANDGQRAAVEAVLAAPDLVLIQGPPGTGKTTVIAEICYQVARRGGRTLIASQANLAVDNALSRLQHNPVIRAVRKGRRGAVGPEGEPFLEDKVIGTWLKNTSADCEKGLSKRLDTVRMFRQLLASSERFAAYLEAEETFEPERKRLQDRRASLEPNYQARVNAYAEAETQQRQIESLSDSLAALLASAPRGNWEEPAVVNLLARLRLYSDPDKAARDLTANVHVAIDIALELGLVPPERSSFGLAAWLRDTVPAWINNARTALAYTNDTATAMIEAEFSQQVFQQHSTSLVRLQETHRQFLATQQSHQQEIANLQNCNSGINSVISADSGKDLSQRLDTVRMFRQLLASSARITAYLQAEENFEPNQKLLQDRRLSLESDCRAEESTYKQAQTRQSEIESLNNALLALLAGNLLANWEEPGIINLLARLKSYLNENRSARDLATNVRAAVDLTVEFGLVPPEGSSFGLAAWLQDTVAAKIAECRKALANANEAVIAMAEVKSQEQVAEQRYADLNSLRKTHLKVENRRSAIDLAINELEFWSSTADSRVYEVLKKCLQKRQLFTEDLIPLPSRLLLLAPETSRAPWQQHLRELIVKVNESIERYRQWDRAYTIANELDDLISLTLNALPTKAPDEMAVYRATKALEIHGLAPTAALKKLRQETLSSIAEIRKPLGFGGRILEWLLAAASNWKLCQPSRRSTAVATLEAIRRQAPAIVQSEQPSGDIESAADFATTKVVNGIVASAGKWLKKQLNEQSRLGAELEKQILATQKQVKTPLEEAQQRCSRAIELLQRVAQSQLPPGLRTLAEIQYPRTVAEIQAYLPQFSAQVRFWESHTSMLETLIPTLDPLAVLSNIKTQIGLDLAIQKEVTETAIRQFTGFQNQLHEIDAQLQHQLNHLTAERHQVKAEIERRLQLLAKQLNEQMNLATDLQRQISATEEQVEATRREADLRGRRVIVRLQELIELPQVPADLRILAERYLQNPSDSLDQAPQLLAQVRSCESRTSQLETLIPSLDPFGVLSTFRNSVAVELATHRKVTETAQTQLQQSQTQLDAIERQLQQQLKHLNTKRTWWQEAWSAIPDRLKPVVPSTGLFNLDFLGGIQAQFHFWQQELAKEEAYLNRYQHIVSDWIAKLRNPSDQDSNELRRIYLDNANVIGITCSQSAKRDFSEEFKSFDVVIIDEVSKCTPPELLIPALKGKKLVLVGDHRQLPPMLDSKALEDIAEELGSTEEELSFLEQSLFKSQFEAAGEGIKKMLTTQYRMHPSIMGAINQFYDNKLECGLFDADKQRAHHLAGSVIKENHHLIWVQMPVEHSFKEQKDGTSFANVKEIEVIATLCQQMEKAWFPKIKQGEPRKEIGIITFYGRQLKLIEDRIDAGRFPSLHIRTGTVDRFQGMESQVVIVSMVRNNDQQQVGFAKKPERVNVAFSRAQELLVIVGCRSLFTQQGGRVGSMYSNVSNVVRLHGGFVNVSDILC